jgi:CRISPR-associated protein Csb2
MFAIEVTFLGGRYVATEFNQRDLAEWPPHPTRLFAALVASWGTNNSPNTSEAAALRALEQLDPPDIVAEHEPVRRSIVSHFVPDNDVSVARDHSSTYNKLSLLIDQTHNAKPGKEQQRSTAALQKELSKAVEASAKATAPDSKAPLSGLAVLPEERTKQARFFPTICPTSPTVMFVWRDELPVAMLDALDDTCFRVHRLGHSSSLVSCRVLRNIAVDPDAHRFTPGRAAPSLAIRAPSPGMFDRLVEDFQVHQASEPRTTPTKSFRYTGTTTTHAAPSSDLSGDFVAVGFSTKRPTIKSSLAIASALRGAMLSVVPDDPLPLLTGHEPGPRPSAPLSTPHVSFVALPWVGHDHADGRLMGAALVLPKELEDSDHSAIRERVNAWVSNNPYLAVNGQRFTIDTESDPPLSLYRSTWSKPSTTWASVTPIALDRYPSKRLAETGALEEAETIIADSCRHVGLPAPAEVRATLQSVLRGSRNVREFGTVTIGGRNRACVHAILRWEEPVSGPMLLGAGRYIGMGLMYPVEE